MKIWLALIVCCVAACGTPGGAPAEPVVTYFPAATAVPQTAVPPTATTQPTRAVSPTAPRTPTVAATPAKPTATPWLPAAQATPIPLRVALNLVQPPPVACSEPPHDYRRVDVNGEIINLRTLWMLKLAESLYAGKGSPLIITQGSFSTGVALSFGTHAGGGAVDIGVVERANPRVRLGDDDMLRLNAALRQAGFAAWIRRPEDLKPSTVIHIHAIAVGDLTLSPDARAQVDGPIGYFSGWDAVPPEFGGTKRDRYGGPVMCAWMQR